MIVQRKHGNNSIHIRSNQQSIGIDKADLSHHMLSMHLMKHRRTRIKSFKARVAKEDQFEETNRSIQRFDYSVIE
ncbi:hypothetical protein LguiA_025776 [Lonicera macranthoides]